MINEKQKTTTNTYRENWERIYGGSLLEKAKQRERLTLSEAFNRLAAAFNEDYPNGCPILEDK